MGRWKWTLGGRNQKAVQGKKKEASKLSFVFVLFCFFFLSLDRAVPVKGTIHRVSNLSQEPGSLPAQDS